MNEIPVSQCQNLSINCELTINTTEYICNEGLTFHNDFMSTNACTVDVNEHFIFHSVNISLQSMLLMFAIFYIHNQRRCMTLYKKPQTQSVAARFSGDMNKKKLYYYFNCLVSFMTCQLYSICCLYKFQQCDEVIIMIMIFLTTTVEGGLWIVSDLWFYSLPLRFMSGVYPKLINAFHATAVQNYIYIYVHCCASGLIFLYLGQRNYFITYICISAATATILPCVIITLVSCKLIRELNMIVKSGSETASKYTRVKKKAIYSAAISIFGAVGKLWHLIFVKPTQHVTM